jgi:long-chain fatty acid transport protein
LTYSSPVGAGILWKINCFAKHYFYDTKHKFRMSFKIKGFIMSKKLLVGSSACLFSLFLFITDTSLATSGSVEHGHGVRARAMGGVAAAYPQDSLVSAINPAGITEVPQSVDLGMTFIFPNHSYAATTPTGAMGVAPGTHRSRIKLIPLPTLGYINHLSDTKYTFSIASYSDGGGSEYSGNIMGATIPGSTNGVYGQGLASIVMGQGYIDFALATKIHPKISLGGAVVGAVQAIQVKGLGSLSQLLSVNPGAFTNRGLDLSIGAGVKFGFLADLTDYLAIGASIQPTIPMTKFQKYRGTLPRGGSLDIPPKATAGVTLKVKDNLVLAGDVQRIWFSAVPGYSNSSNCPLQPGVFPPTPVPCLGDTAGFGWRDTTLYKVGVRWDPTEDWALRAGYAHTSQPVQPTDLLLNILAPLVAQDHITFGVSKKIAADKEISFGGMVMPRKTVTGLNPSNPTQTISVKMQGFELGANMTWFF